MHLPAFDGLPQRLARREHVLLPDELVQRARAHAIRERPHASAQTEFALDL
jgi:hypothetical protein